MWQSPDPILASYMDGGPVGGIFTPANLSLYSYAHQRPIVRSDPNGELAFIPFLLYAAYVGAVGVTAYEVTDTAIDVYNGDKTVGEAAGEMAVDVAIGVTVGGVAKVGGKLVGRYGDDILRAVTGKADDVAEAGIRQVDNAVAAAAPPQVVDAKLGNLVDNIFKGARNPNRTGDGSLAAAIRHQLSTGELVGGKDHLVKGRETIRGLENWLDNTPDALAVDRTTAVELLGDLQEAFAVIE